MGRKAGSPNLYLVSTTGQPRDTKLSRRAAFVLEECRAMLLEGGEHETVKLLDMVLLQLRMKLRGVSETELKQLCAALTGQEKATQLCDGA